MKKIILIITFILSALSLVSFYSIDACVDAGGLWSNFGMVCKGAHSDFVPQYKRIVPIFWGLILFLSGLVTFFVSKVV